MRKKITMMLFMIASFVAFTNTQLEAVSASPSVLVVGVLRGTARAVFLSTNTIATNLDAQLTAAAATFDKQLIGNVEYNATNMVSATPSQLVLSQLEEADVAEISGNTDGAGAPLWAVFANACGNNDDSDSLRPALAVAIYCNIDTTNPMTTDEWAIVPLAEVPFSLGGSAISPPSGTAGQPANNVTYCGQIGILAFYVVESDINSQRDGLYTGNFIFGYAEL